MLNAYLRYIFMSFLQFFLKLVLELHPQRGVFGVLRRPFGVGICNFVHFFDGNSPK